MKNIFNKSLFILIICVIFENTAAQTQFTPYDDLPGIIKSYKPAYQDEFPQWAKMLYQYPVNFFDIIDEYVSYSLITKVEKNPENRYFKIWKRAIEPYVLNDGTIKLPDLDKINQQLRISQLQAGKKTVSKFISNWTFLGPKETFWLNSSGSPQPPNACPWQVNVYSFDVAPYDSNILYCGTETGFVNKSINKGLNWEFVAPDYFFGGAITAVAIHPISDEVVFVSAGQQIHKTLDGGNSWTPMLSSDELFHADRLKIDPNNPDKILAAATTGVFISNDGGLTWLKNWNNPSYDVEIKQDDSDVIFAITVINGKFSVVISTDGGENFSPDLGFPTDIADASGGLLAVTPSNPDIILAVMLSSDYTPYLYKGTLISNFWNWNLLATGQTLSFPMNNGQGYFDLVLEVSPNDENLIFTGTTTLFKSTNGGQEFTAIGGYQGNFSIHPDIQDMKLLPGGETWVSTDGGFSLTKDNFTDINNFSARNNGLIGSDMWGFDQGWNEDIVVGGRYHNGNTAVADFYQPKALRMGGAESPTGWVLQGKSRHVAFNDLGNGWILPQTAEGEPEGRFIFSKYPNMDEYGGRRGNMVFHPNFYGTIYLGEGNGFWKSTDLGVSYDLLNDFGNRVRYLQISYSNPDILYADIVNKGLYKTEDGGENWTLKPSLTNGQYANAYWRGRLFFAISPYNENTIYACLQNGTWSADIGKVFRSSDGGDTWEDWTGSLSEYTKCLVVPPTPDGKDLVYLFTNARNGQISRVFCREDGMIDWESYNNNYPAGMTVNLALPFFRDSKLRVAGNSGIWESPLKYPEYNPIINPWIEKSFYNCFTDTLYFDDHSIMNHDGVSWEWEIIPSPAYIDNPNIRNPKVVLENPGTYSVNFSVTKNGVVYTKYMQDMITATTCPSIEDCDNPAEIPKNEWDLIYVDSEEVIYPGLAIMSFDDEPSTIWHTRWSTGVDPYPHEIQIDLGMQYKIFKFIILNRQNGQNGRIKEYELYISEDTLNWGLPVSIGELENTAAPQTIVLETPAIGRYFRLIALSEVNGGPWSSAAEFSLVGCIDITYTNFQMNTVKTLKAFPVPTNGILNISLPNGKKFEYQIFSLMGQIMEKGTIDRQDDTYPLNLNNQPKGIYFIRLTSDFGIIYRIKVIKD